MPSEDDNAVLSAVADLFAPAAAPVFEALHRRMADVAAAKGAAFFWDWVAAQIDRPLDGPVRAAMDGYIVGWLLGRPAKRPKDEKDSAGKVQLAQVATALADALDELESDVKYFLPVDDGMYAPERASLHLAPRLRALASCIVSGERSSRRSRVRAMSGCNDGLAKRLLQEIHAAVLRTVS